METDWKRIGVACDLAGKRGAVTIARAEDHGFAVGATDGVNVLHVGSFAEGTILGSVQSQGFGAAALLPALSLLDMGKHFQVTSPGVEMDLIKIAGGAVSLGSGPFQSIGDYGHGFLEAIGSVSHARKSGENDRIMAGIHFSYWRKRNWVQCTDAKRLAIAPVGPGSPPENTIHPTTVKLLEKVWTKTQRVLVSSSPNGMRFAAMDGSWSVYGSGLDGNYPNLLSLVDELDAQEVTASFAPEEMIIHLERAQTFSKGEGGSDVEVTMTDEGGCWVCASSVIGSYEGRFDLLTKPKALVGWVWSPDYALDWLTQAKEVVEIKIAQSDAKILLRSGELMAMIAPKSKD
jgi:hypothetical protein